jgi:hypothetical protein
MTTATKEKPNFFGITITGDVSSNRAKQTKQRPATDLQPAIQDVIDLAGDDFVGFRWAQYIPGFNDGDPCVFNTGEVTVRYADIPGEDDENPEGDNEDGWVYTADQWVTGGPITRSRRRDKTQAEYDADVAEWKSRPYNAGREVSSYTISRDVWEDIPTGVTVEKRSNADAVEKLAGLIESSAFDHALQEAFGDNAEVTLTKEGFSVEYYDCGH